jgi:translation initiation factor IF-1
MSKEQPIEVEGVVVEAHPGGSFDVKLDKIDHIILCQISGRLRKFSIKVIPGDLVKVEMSPYDLTKGRIVYRNKK